MSQTTTKSISEFIESLKENAPDFNFDIRHIFNMGKEYKNHGVEIDEDFQLYQITVCNFVGSYRSISKNAKRAAAILEPKQIIVYKEGEMTAVDYLPFTKEFIEQSLPEDKEFAVGLAKACQNITRLIKTSL